jgi:hypothetical protein
MVLIISIMTQTRDIQTALETFRQHGGVMRTSQALLRGIHPAALYRLVEDGQLMRLARGLYRLSSAHEFSNPDLAVVAAKAPDAVVCLISALAFHAITTQVPRAVHLAVPRGRYAGLRLRTPPVKIYRFDVPTFDQGIQLGYPMPSKYRHASTILIPAGGLRAGSSCTTRTREAFGAFPAAHSRDAISRSQAAG